MLQFVASPFPARLARFGLPGVKRIAKLFFKDDTQEILD